MLLPGITATVEVNIISIIFIYPNEVVTTVAFLHIPGKTPKKTL